MEHWNFTAGRENFGRLWMVDYKNLKFPYVWMDHLQTSLITPLQKGGVRWFPKWDFQWIWFTVNLLRTLRLDRFVAKVPMSALRIKFKEDTSIVALVGGWRCWHAMVDLDFKKWTSTEHMLYFYCKLYTVNKYIYQINIRTYCVFPNDDLVAVDRDKQYTFHLEQIPKPLIQITMWWERMGFPCWMIISL